jgi:hypothetical protein
MPVGQKDHRSERPNWWTSGGEQVDFSLHVRRVKAGTPSTHPIVGDELRALRLSRTSIADEVGEEHCRRVLGE